MENFKKRYLLTWLALLILLGLSFGSAFIDMGNWNAVTNFGIAILKALLVALVFMRVASSGTLVKILALAAVFALSILFALSGADFATRQMSPAPWQQPQQLAPLSSSPSSSPSS